MRVSELLRSLRRLAKTYELQEPYIVGGLPRDRALGKPANIKDIDITVGNNDSVTLALVAAKEWPKAHFKLFDDGHSSLRFKNVQLDFSNNYTIKEIDKELKNIGIDNPTDLQKEIYSRDFTINTLLQPMDLSKPPIDITGYGFQDIKNRVLRTPIDAELTIGYDPRRILRALKLVLKYGLTVDDSLKDALLKYRGSVSETSMGQIKKQVNQMLDMDSKQAIELLSEYKLLPIIPLSKLLTREITKHRMIQNLLDDRRV